MVNLHDILQEVNILHQTGTTGREIRNITEDSRKVGEGDVFVAIDGTGMDGHKFIGQALEKGAAAVVYQNDDYLQEKNDVAFIKTEDSRQALAAMASAYFGHPSRKLQVIGITGTNGKTSIVTMLYRLFREVGEKTGMLSTVEIMINDKQKEATHTTPGPMIIHELLREMADNGCRYCFMEVSSHAIDQHRTGGIDFKGAVFTNITHDHLDYHKTFDQYLTTKKKLFDNLNKESFALVNADDKRREVMVQNCAAKVATYGLKNAADYKTKILEADFSGMLLDINGQQAYVTTVGDYNASNLTAAYAVGDLLGLSPETNLTALSKTGNIPGRMQVIKEDEISGVVDYAHSPDALEKVLETIKRLNKQKGQIITVIGCGGDRDKAKRPEMGKIAARRSDKAIFTSDNPRNEDPLTIIQEMKAGVDEDRAGRVITNPDRKEAINMACMFAQKGDIVLVAGKGHEKFQVVKDEKLPFDDLKILQEYLKEKL